MKINQRQFKKWIAALDSGEFKQSSCDLQNRNGYCCLGVGCAVIIPKAMIDTDVNGFIRGGMPDQQPAAPVWLANINGDFRMKTGKDLLSLNDTYGFTFPEIATLLELVYIHKILE